MKKSSKKSQLHTKAIHVRVSSPRKYNSSYNLFVVAAVVFGYQLLSLHINHPGFWKMTVYYALLSFIENFSTAGV